MDSSKGKNAKVAGGMPTTEPPKNAIEGQNLGIQAKQAQLSQTVGDRRMITTQLTGAEKSTTQSNVIMTKTIVEETEAGTIGVGVDRRHPSGDSGVGDELTGLEPMDVGMPPVEANKSRMNLNGVSASKSGPPNTQTAHQQNDQPLVQSPDDLSLEQERRMLEKHRKNRKEQENRRQWERRLHIANREDSSTLTEQQMDVDVLPAVGKTKPRKNLPTPNGAPDPKSSGSSAAAAGLMGSPVKRLIDAMRTPMPNKPSTRSYPFSDRSEPFITHKMLSFVFVVLLKAFGRFKGNKTIQRMNWKIAMRFALFKTIHPLIYNLFV